MYLAPNLITKRQATSPETDFNKARALFASRVSSTAESASGLRGAQVAAFQADFLGRLSTFLPYRWRSCTIPKTRIPSAKQRKECSQKQCLCCEECVDGS
ncbi:hypothetical protein NDU88_005308, partial [Pleurodeles waltl]